jgi:DNA-binding NarL/FixJ family response regulator
MLYDSLTQADADQNLTEDCQAVISIHIVAKADFVVDGMVSFLQSHRDRYSVTVISPDDFSMSHCKEFSPDVLLINNNALSQSPSQLIRDIQVICKDTIVLLFGQAMSDSYLYDAIRAGARGYLNEKMRASHLITALEEVINGGYWVERKIMYKLISDKSIHDKIDENISALSINLSVRESEVLELLLEGMTTNEISERIFLSHQGVKAHLTSLFRKFEVKNRAQLIIHAMDVASPTDSLATTVGKGLKQSRNCKTTANAA